MTTGGEDGARTPPADPSPGRIWVRNLIDFVGILRATGIPVSVQQSQDAARALTLVDLAARAQVYHALRAVLVSRSEDLALFETVFRLFWRQPGSGEGEHRTSRRRAQRRPRERFTIATWSSRQAQRPRVDSVDLPDRSGTSSDREALQYKRFTSMSPEELDEARRLLDRLEWRVHPRRTRRRAADRRGAEVDLRRVLRAVGRTGSVPMRVPRRRRIWRERPVVVLADVSGSMDTHARTLLQLLHVMVRSLERVETFVFATRLTHVTPHLRLRNVDRALDQAATDVMDWSGGTRIGECIGRFNREWSRRVLRRGAIVVLVSDGCDGGDPAVLEAELRVLRHRCHRLFWLHPHAGTPGFEPRVAGMRAALPYTDELLPADSVHSLSAFARTLARLATGGARRGGSRRGPRRVFSPPPGGRT